MNRMHLCFVLCRVLTTLTKLSPFQKKKYESLMYKSHTRLQLKPWASFDLHLTFDSHALAVTKSCAMIISFRHVHSFISKLLKWWQGATSPMPWHYHPCCPQNKNTALRMCLPIVRVVCKSCALDENRFLLNRQRERWTWSDRIVVYSSGGFACSTDTINQRAVIVLYLRTHVHGVGW